MDLAAPSELKAVSSGYDLTLSWKDNSSGESGFEIWEKVDTWFGTHKTVPANTTSIFLKDWLGGSEEAIYVRAVAPSGKSEFSNRAIVPGNEVVLPDYPDMGATDLFVPDHYADGEDSVGTTLHVGTPQEAWLFLEQSTSDSGSWRAIFSDTLALSREVSPGNYVPMTSDIASEPFHGSRVIHLKVEPIAPDVIYGATKLSVEFTSNGKRSDDVVAFDVLSRVPATPTGLRASISASHHVQLNWTPSVGLGVAGYNVYRLSKAGDFELLEESVYEPQFVDENSPFGSSVTYRVTAYDWEHVESAPATVSMTPPVDNIAPAPVSNFKAVAAWDGVSLNWKPSPSTDVVGYEMTPSVDTGWYIEVPVTFGADVTSTADGEALSVGKITYTLRAIDGAGNKSDPVSVTVQTEEYDFTPPAKPKHLTVTLQSDGDYRIDWDDSPEDDFSYYNLYRGGHLFMDYVDVSEYVAVDAGEGEFTVTAVDRNDNESLEAYTDDVAPDPPSNLRGTLSDKGVLVQFDPSPSTDVDGYFSYVKFGDGNFIPTDGLDASQTSFLDVFVAPGTVTTYEIVAHDPSHNESSPVDVVIAVPMTPVENLSATAVSETRVDLDWDDFYRSGVDWDVYRNTTPEFAPTLSTRIARGLLDSGFSDSTAAPGTTYYYKVIAVGLNYSAEPVEVSVTTLGTSTSAEIAKGQSNRPVATITAPTSLFSGATSSSISQSRALLEVNSDQRILDDSEPALSVLA